MPRTYVRKQSIAVNKSTLALNALLATNMAKQQLTTKNKQQKRRKRIIKIKDLPPTKTTELLDEDNSIHLNCTNKDNTFDRLVAGENYNSVRIVPDAVNTSEENTSSFLPSIVLKSILQTSNDRLGSVRHITGSSILDISLEKIASWSDVTPDFITKRKGRNNGIVKAKNRIEDSRNDRGACKITASPNKPRRFFHDEFAGFSKEEFNVSKNLDKNKTDLLDTMGGKSSPKRREDKSKKRKLKSYDRHLPKARNSHVPSSTPIKGKQPPTNKKHNKVNNNTSQQSHLITVEEMTSMRDLSLSRIDVNNSISNNDNDNNHDNHDNNDNNDHNYSKLESSPRGKLVLNGREEIVIELILDEEKNSAALEKIKSLRVVERVRLQLNSGEKEKRRSKRSTQSSLNDKTSPANKESTALSGDNNSTSFRSNWDCNDDSGDYNGRLRLRPRPEKSLQEEVAKNSQLQSCRNFCKDSPRNDGRPKRNIIVPVRYDGLMERTMSKITIRKRLNNSPPHNPPSKLPSFASTPIKPIKPVKISTENVTKRKKTKSPSKIQSPSTPISLNKPNSKNKPRRFSLINNESEISALINKSSQKPTGLNDESQSLIVDKSQSLIVEESQSLVVDKSQSLIVEESQSLLVEESQSLVVEDSQSLVVEDSQSLATVDCFTPRKRRNSMELLLETSSHELLEGSDELDEEVAGFHHDKQQLPLEWSKERKTPPVTRSRSRALTSLGISDGSLDPANKKPQFRKQRSHSVTHLSSSESNNHTNWSYHTLHSSNPLDNNRHTPLKSILKRTKSFNLDNRPNSSIDIIKRNNDSEDDCVITSWKYKNSRKSRATRKYSESGSGDEIRLISRSSSENELSGGGMDDGRVDGLKREEFVFVRPVLKVIIPGKKYRRSMRQSRLVNEKRESINGNVFTSVRRSSIKLSPIKSKVTGHDTVDSNKKQPPVNVDASEEAHQQQRQSVFEELLANLSLVHGNNNRQVAGFVDESFGGVINEESVVEANEDRTGSFVSELDRGTARELVLRKCGQREPELWEKYYPESLLKNCRKIGEGVYGEVFLFRNAQKTTSVMKVIPIEGSTIVNGEPQKKYGDIISEIVIAMELSNLRNNPLNTTSGFSKLLAVRCVQGQYPDRLIDLWQLYDEDRGSENDSPEFFTSEQLYIVLELADGGKDLESYVFNNAQQAYSLFVQTACALAVAEGALEFEHRDLHWGNILISRCDRDATHNFLLDGSDVVVPSDGVQVCIIDFTLSRMTVDDVCIYNDLALDPDLFTADGDLQFEVYRKMQQLNGNDWKPFKARSNIFWLDYILDKMIKEVRYQDKTTKLHMTYIKKLKRLRKVIVAFNSVTKFVQSTRFDYS